MSDELQDRLRKLGVVKGAREIKPVPEVAEQITHSPEEQAMNPWDPVKHFSEAQTLNVLLPGGQLEENELGTYFVIDRVYPLKMQHGDRSVGDFLEIRPGVLAEFISDKRLSNLDTRDFLYLDTETTGLSGAGTFAFMIGAAFFEDEALVVRQFFARDHADEPPMLLSLIRLVNRYEGLITFNGRTFDLPLLETRYLMNRMDDQIGTLRTRPHLDLLPPSRRLWRRRLGSCSLGSLEKNLLGIERSHEDVPGWLIPGIYMDYLRSGDARELVRVFYHNHVDMLSMVILALRVYELIAQKGVEEDPLDILSLAKWQVGLGRTEEAEEILKLALAQRTKWSETSEIHNALRYDLGLLLRKMDRRHEALEHWQEIAQNERMSSERSTIFGAYIELAKYYEWHHQDLALARQWTMQAKSLVEQADSGLDHEDEAVKHRLGRLDRKLADRRDL